MLPLPVISPDIRPLSHAPRARIKINVVQHYMGTGKLTLTGGMVAKLKHKLRVASKAVAELEELLADI